MPDEAPLLKYDDLRERYGERTAVDGISFIIARGETYGLLGPNGAGKTTTISMVCGLLERDGGAVSVAGLPMEVSATSAKSHIGYVPQDLAIYPDLTARENLRFFGRLQQLRGKVLDARVATVLELTGLADRANDRTSEVSGGMKRRLNVGIGLLHEPSLLVLDEPTVGVDPQSRNAILEAVAELGEGGMSILYTTHYMEEAERLCDRIGILDEGRILAEGTRRELVETVGQRDRVTLTAKGSLTAAAEALTALDRVDDVTVTDGSIEIVASSARTLLAQVIAATTDAGASINSVEVTEPQAQRFQRHVEVDDPRNPPEVSHRAVAVHHAAAGGDHVFRTLEREHATPLAASEFFGALLGDDLSKCATLRLLDQQIDVHESVRRTLGDEHPEGALSSTRHADEGDVVGLGCHADNIGDDRGEVFRSASFGHPTAWLCQCFKRFSGTGCPVDR